MNIRVYAPSIKQLLLIAGILLSLFALYTLFTFEPRAEARPLPNVTLEDQNGDLVSLREITNGKVSIVNVWASWCPYCVQELPDFAQLAKMYPDVAIIAVNRKESQSEAETYLRKQGLVGGLTVLFDEHDDFYRAINGVGMPETVIVNKQGYIVLHRHGPMTFAEMEAAVRQVTEN